MANIFKKNQELSERQMLENKYVTSRANLLFVVIFTAVNILLLFVSDGTYFLFSAIVPYFIAFLGALKTGMMSESFYEYPKEQLLFEDTSYLVMMMTIAIVILAVYLVCWLLSKKQVGWLIVALVLFGIDTIGLFVLNGFSAEILVDVLFHAWVIYYLGSGVYAHYKLKKLPPEPEEQDIESIPTTEEV